MLIAQLVSAGLPPIPPDANGLPGGSQTLGIVGGIMFYALVILLVGLLVGAASWWGGGRNQHYGMASFGRSAVIGSVLGILLVGASVAIANWALGLGVSVTALGPVAHAVVVR